MPDPITAAVSAVKGGSAILQKKNTKKAAKKTAAELAAGQEKSLALQKEIYEKQVALQNPFLQSGNLSNAELMRQMGLAGDATSAGYGNMLRDFSTEDFQADPGYAFRLSEGLKALDRTAAMRGKMMSGQALKAAGRYGQDVASQEYQNAYNRYNTNNLNRYNMLAGQQNVGMNAADRIGQAGQFYATGGGQNIVGASQARASQYQPIANASNAMIGSLGSMGTQLLGGFNKSPGDYSGAGYGAGPYAPPVGTPGINY
jgi:hypothetical protein